MELERGDVPIQHDLSEIADIEVQGVEQKQIPHHLTVTVNGVEDGGHPHDELGQNTPEVLHVSEKDKQRRQDQADAQVEYDQAHSGVEQEQKFPGERNPIDSCKSEKHQKCQPEVDKR